MRVDQVIRDPRRTLQEVLRAFDSNLTARDNFAPEGELGQFLGSNGPDSKPTYKTLTAALVDSYTRAEVDALLGSHTHDGGDIVSGQVLPEFLGTGVRDGTRFLRDDGAYSLVPWSSLSGVPTTLKGYGLDDDVAAALAPYSRIGHVHDYNSLMNLPAPAVGVTLDVLRQELIGYQRRGQTNDYNTLQNLPTVTGVTTDDLRKELRGYSRIGHVHDYGSLMNTPATGGTGISLQDVRNELVGYQRRGFLIDYDALQNRPTILTAADLRAALAPYQRIGKTQNYDELQNQPNFLAEGRGYSRIGHNQYFEMEAVAQEYILANQIFGG